MMRKPSNPRVSIGLPVYNGENFLAPAIASLLGQTFGDFELIISDNGSSDGTEAICRRFAAKDRRVCYYRSEDNHGVAWNFNRVFELAQGEYFKWAAHDDVNAPTQLERCVKVLDDNPDVVLAGFQSAVIDAAGDMIVANGEGDGSCELQGVPAHKEQARLIHAASVSVATRYRAVLIDSIRCYEVFGLIRSEAIRRTSLHGAYRGSEKIFLGELALQGRFLEIPEVLFFSRWHDARYSANTSAKAQAEHFNPGSSRNRFVPPFQLRCAWEHCRMLWGKPITLLEKLQCLAVLGRWLLQPSKWARIVAKLLLNRGDSVLLPDNVRRGPRHPNYPEFVADAESSSSLETAKQH